MADIIIGEKVRNNQGEVGTIVSCDEGFIVVAYGDRQAKLLTNAFEKGFLRYEDSDFQYFIDEKIEEEEEKKRKESEERLIAEEKAKEACRKMEATAPVGVKFNSVSIRLDPYPASFNSVKARHKKTVQEIFLECDRDINILYGEFEPKMKYIRQTRSYVYYGTSSFRSRYCTAFLSQYSGAYVMRVFSRNDVYKPGVMGGFTVTNSDTTEILRIISIDKSTYCFSKHLTHSGMSYMNTSNYDRWQASEFSELVTLDKIVKKCDCGYLNGHIEQENVNCREYARMLMAALYNNKAEIVFKHKAYSALAEIEDIVGYLEEFSSKQIDFACKNNVLNTLPIIKRQGLFDLDVLTYMEEIMAKRRNAKSIYENIADIFDQFNLDSSVMDKRLIDFVRKAIDFNANIYRDYLYDLARQENVTIDDVFDKDYEERHYIISEENRVYYSKHTADKYAAIAKELSWIDREENGYFVIVPKNIPAIKEEGRYQHHCVYTNRYFNDVINRRSIIVFLRKEKKTPYITIEFDYDTFTVLQARRKFNQVPDDMDYQYIKSLSKTLHHEKLSQE